MSKGTRRHIVPANSIGFFSAEGSGHRRNRRIYCRLKRNSATFATTPDKVGWSRTVYGAGKGRLLDHDRYFANFESMNDESITALLHEKSPWKSADTWIKLVAYVSSRITRNPDRELSSVEEFAKWKGGGGIGYPLNLQRLSAAALRCRWDFIQSPAQDFVLNDRGFAGILHPGWQAPALFLPLRRDCAVVIGGGARHQKELVWQDDSWAISIPTATISRDSALRLNAISWIGAREECYAATPKVLENAALFHQKIPTEIENLALANDYVYPILGSTLDECMQDEMLLFRLLGGIRVRESEEDPLRFWI